MGNRKRLIFETNMNLIIFRTTLLIAYTSIAFSFTPNKLPRFHKQSIGCAMSSSSHVSKPLDIIEKDAVGSRAEPGCLCFDVVQSQDKPNKFFIYEIYADKAAVVFHKEQPYFKPWTEFKACGGTISSISHRGHGLYMNEM